MSDGEWNEETMPTNSSSTASSTGSKHSRKDSVSSVASTANYSFAGVLDFLQSEYRRFEKERELWYLERAELQARIVQLEAERRSNENIKYDLLRRIKMFEFALRQERLKYSHNATSSTTATNNTESKGLALQTADEIRQNANTSELLSKSNDAVRSLFGKTPKSSELLRKYLEDINCSEAWTLVTKASEYPARTVTAGDRPFYANVLQSPQQPSRLAAAFENNQDATVIINNNDNALKSVEEANNNQRLENGTKSPKASEIASSHEQESHVQQEHKAETRAHEIEQQQQPHVEQQEECKSKSLKGRPATPPDMAEISRELNIGKNDLARLMKRASLTRAQQQHLQPLVEQQNVASDAGEQKKEANKPYNGIDLNELGNINVEDENAATSLDISSRKHRLWKPKYALKSHLDSVRTIAFHPTQSLILSGSEDCTVKVWSLNIVGVGSKKTVNSPDSDPLFTYRGHTGPVFAVACGGPTLERDEVFFSAGADGTVRAWGLVPETQEIYSEQGVCIAHSRGVFVGHTDAIWDLSVHPFESHVLSASSDGTVKLWDYNRASPLQLSYSIEDEKIPTSVSYLHTDNKKFIASYTTSDLCVFDVETGAQLWKAHCADDPISSANSKPPVPQEHQDLINMVTTHPTLPLAITAHEDRSVRFFDLNSGKCVHKMIGHLDSVSCVAVDPSGMYFITGGHDSSLRVWDLTTKSCVQEISTHRKKYDESIHAVAYHPTKSFIGTGGADAVIKIYQ
eukprot:GEZU01013469.1.p1 GENE.GEZU01013469.1~~GEZU01013469.1.p1  ORF type:complete len:745 (-),score=163.52 GEZU01013469.1:262-2496(-)